MVSLKNLSTLATNIISNNGQTLNLNFSGIHILPFRGMVSPFNIQYNDIELKRLAKSFWYPCDGKDNRPNLINRFIYGGQNVGNTGGAETVTLTTEQLPSHKHKAIIRQIQITLMSLEENGRQDILPEDIQVRYMEEEQEME